MVILPTVQLPVMQDFTSGKLGQKICSSSSSHRMGLLCAPAPLTFAVELSSKLLLNGTDVGLGLLRLLDKASSVVRMSSLDEVVSDCLTSPVKSFEDCQVI